MNAPASRPGGRDVIDADILASVRAGQGVEDLRVNIGLTSWTELWFRLARLIGDGHPGLRGHEAIAMRRAVIETRGSRGTRGEKGMRPELARRRDDPDAVRDAETGALVVEMFARRPLTARGAEDRP